jgi:hypothetical protein
MKWNPTAHMDEEIRGWMKGKGWEANTHPEYDARKRICSWFHEPQRGPAIVAAEIRRQPAVHLVVVQKGRERGFGGTFRGVTSIQTYL